MTKILQADLLTRAGELGFTNTNLADGRVRAAIWYNMLTEQQAPLDPTAWARALVEEAAALKAAGVI
jgi:hypothetical protein